MSNKIRKWFASLVVLSVFCLHLLVGCGGQGLIEIKGKVMHENKALKAQGLSQAVVQYHDENGNVYPGNIDDEGNYRLQAPPGRYKIAVIATKAPKSKNVKEGEIDYSSPEPVIHNGYFSTFSSGLEMDVKEGAPDGHYDLKLKTAPKP